MFNPQTEMLSHFLAARAAELVADPTADAPWTEANNALGTMRSGEQELAAALDARDLPGLQAILEGWSAGKRPLPEHDRDLLKRAMRAFRKRLGFTQLDSESSLGGGPMSGGRASDIKGITPPNIYPRAIWLELARQGRLTNAGQGVFELPRS